MDFLLDHFGSLLPLAMLTLAPAAATWWVLSARRSRRGPARPAAATAALDVAIALLAGWVLALVFLPFPGPGAVHLVPGTDLLAATRDEDAFWQVAANVVMLLPLGVLLPLRWAWWREQPRVTVAALCGSSGIEVLQHVVGMGRICSTDDVLVNTLGAAAGAALVTRPSPRTGRHDVAEFRRYRNQAARLARAHEACRIAQTSTRDRTPPVRDGAESARYLSTRMSIPGPRGMSAK
ncbi:VanZ family protein [Prauserella oleivorans]|uniref:VanZ family protein n=1 Tax=Prauserella oleivorans TaxID=1478153 RepID=A0ABW5WAC5_9PSEU